MPAKEDTRLLHGAGFSAFITAALRNTTDLTTTLNSDNGTVSVLFPATTNVGNTCNYGANAPFDALDIEIVTNGVGVWTLVWEYWNGSAWTALSGLTDGTSQYQAGAGVKRVSFTRPTDWAATTIGAYNKYFIRTRLTAYTSKSANPTADYAKTIVFSEDTSQYLTDLTDSGPIGSYELNSARLALTGSPSREIYVRLVTTSSEKNITYVRHGDNGFTDETYSIAVSGGVKWIFTQNGGTLYTSTASPGDYDVSIGWSTRVNPDTTGVLDALISEINIYNHTAGTWVERAYFTHSVAGTDPTWTFTVGGYWDGAAITATPTNAPTIVRVSEDFHNHVEFTEDWVAARTPHVTSYDQLLEPVGTSLAGDVAEWAGQANVGYLAAQARELRGRMLSPLVNEVYPRARQLVTTLGPVGWMIGAPNSSVYKMDVTGLRWLAVPPGVKYAWVRVNVQTAVTGGASVPIGIRCYSLNRPHIGAGVQLGGKPTPALKYHFAEGLLTANHITPGEWIDLGLLPLSIFTESVPGWQNTTTLILAHAIDPLAASANDAAERLKIRAWHVRPILGEP